jgi:hypothetical protein
LGLQVGGAPARGSARLEGWLASKGDARSARQDWVGGQVGGRASGPGGQVWAAQSAGNLKEGDP